MVLSLYTMPGASTTKDASHGGLEISSCYQPCQLQINLSEEIRKTCTSMIARCTRMTATLDEWILELEGANETLDALIEEEEERTLLESRVDVRDNPIQNIDLSTQPENIVEEKSDIELTAASVKQHADLSTGAQVDLVITLIQDDERQVMVHFGVLLMCSLPFVQSGKHEESLGNSWCFRILNFEDMVIKMSLYNSFYFTVNLGIK